MGCTVGDHDQSRADRARGAVASGSEYQHLHSAPLGHTRSQGIDGSTSEQWRYQDPDLHFGQGHKPRLANASCAGVFLMEDDGH
jgi:hypothetical protein